MAAALIDVVDGLRKGIPGDKIVERTPAPLIPGTGRVKKAAIYGGAFATPGVRIMGLDRVR